MTHSISQSVRDRELLSSETPGSKPKPTFNVREITEDELEKVCWVVSKAFLDDRVTSFCGGFTEVRFCSTCFYEWYTKEYFIVSKNPFES